MLSDSSPYGELDICGEKGGGGGKHMGTEKCLTFISGVFYNRIAREITFQGAIHLFLAMQYIRGNQREEKRLVKML